MSEDTPKPPLEYWHSTEPSPVHGLFLAFFLLLGAAVSGAAVIFASGTGLFLVGEGVESRPNRWILGSGATLLLLGVAACVYGMVRKVRGGRVLALGKRRTIGRFFVLGLLLGCGLACLVEGICFTANAVSS